MYNELISFADDLTWPASAILMCPGEGMEVMTFSCNSMTHFVVSACKQ